jgi:hypothetical protein
MRPEASEPFSPREAVSFKQHHMSDSERANRGLVESREKLGVFQNLRYDIHCLLSVSSSQIFFCEGSGLCCRTVYADSLVFR